MRTTAILVFGLFTASIVLSQQVVSDVVLPAPQSQIARQAAIKFAETIASQGTPEYTAALRKAMALAGGYAISDDAARSFTITSPDLGSPDLDKRYRDNVTTMETDRQRIWGVDSQEVPHGGYPDTVAITGNGRLCTGTVIASSVVLTAAHCYCQGVTDKVLVGESITNPTVPPIKVATSKAMITCTQDLRDGDVAILFLSSPVTVRPRRLAPSALIASATFGRVVGFGMTENTVAKPVGIKRVIDVPMASASCNGTVSTSSGNTADSVFYKCSAGKELVAGAESVDKDTCNGDSGGPLLVSGPNGDFYLAATTSRPTGPPGLRPCGDGGIYVRTDGAVSQWLNTLGVVTASEPPQ